MVSALQMELEQSNVNAETVSHVAHLLDAVQETLTRDDCAQIWPHDAYQFQAADGTRENHFYHQFAVECGSDIGRFFDRLSPNNQKRFYTHVSVEMGKLVHLIDFCAAVQILVRGLYLISHECQFSELWESLPRGEGVSSGADSAYLLYIAGDRNAMKLFASLNEKDAEHLWGVVMQFPEGV